MTPARDAIPRGLPGARPGGIGPGGFVTVAAIATVGVAGSVAFGATWRWLWWGPLAWHASALAGDAIGYLALALWCVRLVRRHRCVADHRPYLAVGLGLVECAVSALVQMTYLVVTEGDAGAWWAGFWQVLAVKTFSGLALWPIVYAGLVLWRLCRRAGHVHARPRYGRGGREEFAI